LSTTRPCPRDKRPYIPSYHHVSLSPDGRRAVWAYGVNTGDEDEPGRAGDHHMTVLDLPSGRELWSLDSARAWAVRFSPDGRRIPAIVRPWNGGNNRPADAAKVFDVESGREAYSFPVGKLLFTGNGSRLVGLGRPDPGATGPLYPLKVWDLE